MSAKYFVALLLAAIGAVGLMVLLLYLSGFSEPAQTDPTPTAFFVEEEFSAGP